MSTSSESKDVKSAAAAAEAKDTVKFGFETTAAEVVKGLDLKHRTAIVTGGAAGLGLETSRALASAGARVVLAVRDAEAAKVKEAIAELIKSTGNDRVDAMSVDLADLASIAAFVAAFKKRNLKLNLLINNAGIMAVPQPTPTAQGFESQFGVNHLGHFFLTALLLDSLLENKPSRVVNVSSRGHSRSDINWDDVMWTAKGAYDPMKAYGQSKTANILMANELHRRFASLGVTGASCHPGIIFTGLDKHLPDGWVHKFGLTDKDGKVLPGLMKTPQQGAATTVVLAASPLLEGKGGVYYEDCNPAGELEGVMPRTRGQAAYTRSEEAGKRLWALTLKLLESHFAAVEGGEAALKLVSA